MNDRLEQLVEELGGNDPRMGTNYRDEDVYADPMTLDQACFLADTIDNKPSPVQFDEDFELFEVAERVEEDWPDVDVYFGGQVDKYAYIDSMYIVYEEIDETYNNTIEDFREYCVLHFKNWMDADPAENEGICPFCDDRVNTGDFERLGEDALFRVNGEKDENLWAAPDEFDFREYDDYGRTVRMWWDD